jgi:glycosyltransferase involved in cell wall biosynthesis
VPRVAFVVQRYGSEIIGGAESYCRQLAEKLSNDLDWNVTVYTTTAKDHMTWDNVYAATEGFLNGVKIVRFHSILERNRTIFSVLNIGMKLLWSLANWARIPSWAMLPFEHIWFHLQGPWSPNLLKAIKEDGDLYDKIFFVTYLYYPVLYGLKIAGSRGVLIPTAHDEPPFFSCLVKKLLKDAPQILALTEAEQSLIIGNLPPAQGGKVSYLGYGLDVPVLEPKNENQAPYLLYLGRISRGKGVDNLIENFLRLLDEKPMELNLYLAGSIDPDFDVKTNDSIKICGRVSDEEKNHLILNAQAVVNPSAHESLSMIIVESMLLGRPALVNTESPVLRFYADQSETVLGFNDYESFRKAVLNIYNDSNLGESLLSERLVRTQNWARDRYSWASVLNKLSNIVSES